MKFLFNIIYYNISRLKLFNLLFNILLGVINIIDNIEEAYLIPLIKNIIKKYIKAENYINFFILIITYNAVNSSTFNLIKEIKIKIRIIEYFIKLNKINLKKALN